MPLGGIRMHQSEVLFPGADFTEIHAVLSRCVGDVAAFKTIKWGRKPHLHSEGGGFRDLCSFDTLDGLISAGLRYPELRAFKDGMPLRFEEYTRGVSKDGVLDPSSRPSGVYDCLSRGATFYFQKVHRLSRPLGRFVSLLELGLGSSVQANAYLTPPNSQGFGFHADTHDVFVVQVEGQKKWAVREPSEENVQPDHRLQSHPGSTPEFEVELYPGDVLYLPRGWVHAAYTGQEHYSLHLAVAVQNKTLGDLLKEMVSQLANDPRFRSNLPIDFIHDARIAQDTVQVLVEELLSWVKGQSVEDVTSRFIASFLSSRVPDLRYQLPAIVQFEDLRDTTKVRARPGTVWILYSTDDVVRVVCGDREVRVPKHFESSVRLLATDSPISVAELDELDDSERRELVVSFVKEGLLDVADGS